MAAIFVPKLLFAFVFGGINIFACYLIHKQNDFTRLKAPRGHVLMHRRIFLFEMFDAAILCVTGSLGVVSNIPVQLSSWVRISATLAILSFPAATNPWIYMITLVSENRNRRKIKRIHKIINSGNRKRMVKK